MVSCIVIEDQPLAQGMLKKYIAQIERLRLKAVFPDVIRASEFLDSEMVDLIFLDIHLPKMSGLDFLRSRPNHPKVILTTAFPEYALESYHFNVVDYLLKPFTYERFLQAINKLESVLQIEQEKMVPQPHTVILKSGHDFIQIPSSHIIYIKSDADYTEVITHDKTYLSKESLKKWLKKLNDEHFCQIHKSYIINMQHLKRFSGRNVYLTNVTLPTGRVYKKDFMASYLKK